MSAERAAQVFDRWSDLADQANRQAAATLPPPLLLRIGSCQVQVQCTSPALQQRVSRVLTHPTPASAAARPDVAIDLVDCRQAGIDLPTLPWSPQRVSAEQETAEFRQGPLLFTQHGQEVMTAMHEDQARTVGFVRDPADWPLDHYKQAIFITLYQQLRRHDLHLVHASAIGRGGQALLLAGSAGAGKTTTMLTCVRAGFDFLGDDATLATRSADGSALVLSLLNTINVTEQTLNWFPELHPHLSTTTNSKGKWLAVVDEVYPGRVTDQATLRMILVPEVTDQERTTLEPAGTLALLRDMLPYSLDLHDAGAAQGQLDFLVTLLRSTPSYRLLLGQDRTELPALLGRLLAAAG